MLGGRRPPPGTRGTPRTNSCYRGPEETTDKQVTYIYIGIAAQCIIKDSELNDQCKEVQWSVSVARLYKQKRSPMNENLEKEL